LAVASRAVFAAACGATVAAAGKAALATGAGLSLLLEWQLLLAYLMLSQLLLLLLSELLSLLQIELLSLLLWLQLLPGLLLGLLLLSFSPPRPSSFVFTSIGRVLAALLVHTWRITGKVHVLVDSMHFKIQSGPGACSDALMVMHHEA
jgi:hypothetical protein